MWRRTLAPLTAVAVSCSCAGAATVTSGLHGVVTRAPIAPVCRAGARCSGPAAHVTVTFSRGGRVTGRTVTDGKGRYRIRLPAAMYVVRTPRRFGTAIAPDQARVRAGVMRTLNFEIDTGIR
jgi:hypothetical protein